MQGQDGCGVGRRGESSHEARETLYNSRRKRGDKMDIRQKERNELTGLALPGQERSNSGLTCIKSPAGFTPKLGLGVPIWASCRVSEIFLDVR